ncbi:MAG: HepT-like ribonuclease domain-containing protein [Desulfococcaceae bacterium]
MTDKALMAKYRNLLIHAYDGVDDSITFGIYKKRLGDFRIFVKSVREYIR